MSRKASPAVIGAFVLAGVALLVIGVLVFGGGSCSRRSRSSSPTSEGSVQGLRVGSNVLFRGVRVGYVTDIDVITDESMLNYQIPVTFEILARVRHPDFRRQGLRQPDHRPVPGSTT